MYFFSSPIFIAELNRLNILKNYRKIKPHETSGLPHFGILSKVKKHWLTKVFYAEKITMYRSIHWEVYGMWQ